jgi:DUF1365 family protein
MKKEEEIVLWSDKKFYSVNWNPLEGELVYRIKVPIKQLEKSYIKSKVEKLKGLT